MNIRATILCIALLVAAPLLARENTDVIMMKNDDRITCEVKGLNGGVLYINPSYILGTVSVDWSKVARLESKQLFLVKTEDGSVHTGTLNTAETPAGRPMDIQVAETQEKKVVLDSSRIVNVAETSEKFLQRFTGGVNGGLSYSKGNQSTQYNLSALVAYPRERWVAQLGLTSTLSHSSGVTASTWNQVTFGAFHLLPWNNYFCGGLGGFLQSAEQGINRQTTLGGGIGRYLKNTNRTTISVLGGFAWQNTHQLQAIHRPHRYARRCCGSDRRGCETLPLQQDQSQPQCRSAPSGLRARSCVFHCERILLHQDHRQSVVEYLVLRQLGQPAAGQLARQQLRHQLRAELDLWPQPSDHTQDHSVASAVDVTINDE